MADFHFLNPEWLLLIIPVVVMLSFSQFKKSNSSAWQKVIEPQLLQHLLQSHNATGKPWLRLLSMAAALIAIVALANPVWDKKPESVFQTPRALVLVLDLSASMMAADLAPSRLIRARLKIRDILERSIEGQTGLVVFAGDAFSVAPLTRDNETITSQLRVLEPRIMPVQGSRVDLGLEEAGKLLDQAGIPAGDILVIADGIQTTQTEMITRELHQRGHRISFMGVGTPEGAPISNGQGGVIRDRNNTPVLARLDEDRFQKLAVSGGGRYVRITLNNSDIDYLLGMPALNHDKQLTEMLAEQNRWKQSGPYITLLLLPLAALAFRRGWLMTLLLAMVSIPLPNPAYAFSWQDLWKTPEQQASEALNQQRHEDALKLSSNPDVLGSAYYRQQQYQQAFDQYKQSQGADADYNQGNALARMAKYKEAIEAYERALQQHPGMQDAIDNKAAIEKLLQDQEQEQQQEQQSQQENNESSDQQEQQSPDKNEQQDSQSEQSEQAQQAEQQPSDAGEQSQQQAGSQQTDPQQDQQSQSSSSNNDFSDAAEAMEKEQQEQQENQPESDSEKESAKPSQAQQASPDEAETQQPELPSALEQEAQPLNSEEQQAAEQWLRRIPDDPGGLLKRKFLYQYQQRNRKPSSQQAW
jgi:Ca-activated chloride channel family protein